MLFYGGFLALWWPLRGVLVHFLAALSGRLLPLLERPPLITSLEVRGDGIILRSFFSDLYPGIDGWSAAPLHFFVVAPFALIFALPRTGRGSRTRVVLFTLVAVVLVCLAICLIQLEAAVSGAADIRLGIRVHTGAEEAFLEWANRFLIMVGMILFPAFLFLLAYMSLRHGPATDLAAGQGRTPGRRDRRFGPGAMALSGVMVGLAVLLWAVAIRAPAGVDPGRHHRGWKKILDLNPDFPPAMVRYGWHLEGVGRWDEAEALYRRAAALEPGMVEAQFSLGTVLSLRERYAEAEGYFRRALELEPDLAHVHKNLGIALVHLGRGCEALEHLERSRQLDAVLFQDPLMDEQIRILRPGCEP